jgi:maltooligosyltrehalose trehalohydrolase
MWQIDEPCTVTLGATAQGLNRWRFRVWAPQARQVELWLDGRGQLEMQAAERGYFELEVDDLQPGARYMYRLDGERQRPDPASRLQPEGVHGPSELVSPSFSWQDSAWPGKRLQDYVIYELHVGTFTPAGTFEAIIPYLDHLAQLGITAIELMPVAQFPGERNWGYDGVYPFAPQASYGGPEGLKRLVDACHQRDLAVVLDVVYNHLGPEGNYLRDYGPYFTDRYRTPWGPAVNFDGPHSDEVRRFFIENAIYWVEEFHVDALRLDAIHAMLDFSAGTFLEELASNVHELAERNNRHVYLIAESDRNDARIIGPRELGGYGLDAQWNDDFHHALHTLLTGESSGYYIDFVDPDGRPTVQCIAKAYQEGFVYAGQYSRYRQHRHGTPARHIPSYRFVVCAQNHDQVGNRLRGERLSALVPFEALKVAAATVLLSPNIPLLFMGEEYGEPAPFQYFVSHSDPQLVEAVRQGRRDEFATFAWQGEVPDPQAERTFVASRLNHELREQGQHGRLLALYRELLALRRSIPALTTLSYERTQVLSYEREQVLAVRRWHDDSQICAIFSYGHAPVSLRLPIPAGRWETILDTASERWGGPGSGTPETLVAAELGELELAPRSCILLLKEADY